jgi:hypothetical protein
MNSTATTKKENEMSKTGVEYNVMYNKRVKMEVGSVLTREYCRAWAARYCVLIQSQLASL